MKVTIVQKDGEISDLKIKIDELKGGLLREMKSREDTQQHYQHRIREKQAELEKYKRLINCQTAKLFSSKKIYRIFKFFCLPYHFPSEMVSSNW